MSLGLLTGYFAYPYNREKNEKKQSQAKKKLLPNKDYTPRIIPKRSGKIARRRSPVVLYLNMHQIKNLLLFRNRI
jgi:hypothetical protein